MSVWNNSQFYQYSFYFNFSISQHVIEVPKSLEEFDEQQQQQQQENRAEISENHENKVDNSENEGSRESPTDSLDEKSYLVEYLHSYVLIVFQIFGYDFDFFVCHKLWIKWIMFFRMGKMSKDQLRYINFYIDFY